MKESNSERREYEVGYGKPPVSTRFKKGERHNSRGRPKRKKALTEIFKKVINEKVTVAAGDASERITKAQAVLRVNVQEALKGSKSAMANVYELIIELGMLDEMPESKRARFFVPRKACRQKSSSAKPTKRIGSLRKRHANVANAATISERR